MAVVSTAILVLVAVLALTANQTPPPAIAEIAPSAVQQIVEAPEEQTSEAGEGPGGAGTGPAPGGPAGTAPTVPGATTTTTAAPPRIERARVRRCVGNPPRQTEDPQSPPCVAFWQGDNGGATYQGVTADTITVAVGGDAKGAHRFETFFNKRFELYGRRLRLIPTGAPADCPGNKAVAVDVDTTMKAFAGIGLFQGNEWCYTEELARRRLIGVSESVFPETWLADHHPYLWQYPSGVETLLTALGRWTCARLAGLPARFADGTDGAQLMSTKQRSFGLILQPYGNTYTPDPAPLEQELARCGARLDETAVFPYGAEHADAATNAVLRMKTEGITTAYCICTVFQTQYLPPQASAQGWFPEWVFTHYGQFDGNLSLRAFWDDAKQRDNVIGITGEPRQWAYRYTPLIAAFKEADPTFDPYAEAGSVGMTNWERFYRMLLLLVSGIQMAGPHLTPETFAAGLQRTVFPNPDHPLQAGKVGFLDRDHTMTNDFGEMWWGETSRSPYEDDAVGTYCYVDGGARRTPHQWPRGHDPFFRPPCDAGLDPPPPERT